MKEVLLLCQGDRGGNSGEDYYPVSSQVRKQVWGAGSCGGTGA